jgi:cellulose synthase/poly-beta-1,6-N-acetylglucosamine synthase-like glycosyltransferase
MNIGVWHDICKCGFWGSFVIVAYTYLGYPAYIYLRSIVQTRKWHQAPIIPSVSVIVAVHNVAEELTHKINHWLTLNYPHDHVEIIVVSDGSTDSTNQILELVRHPRLKAIVCRDHRGKVAALNAGIEIALGEILVFVDIRPWLETNALQFLVSNFADPVVGCAAGRVMLQGTGQDAAMKAVTGLYWRLEQWIRGAESQIDSTIGIYGGFYAVRRTLVRALPEGTILDDLLQCLGVIRQGYRCVLDERACVSDTWPKASRDEFNRKVRTLAGNFQLLQSEPWVLSSQNRLRFELVSHKVLRLVVPLLLALMLASSAFLAFHSRLYAAALLAQCGIYTLAVIGAGGVPVLRSITGPATAFCMLNAAIVVGFYKFIFTRGPLWRIWVRPQGLRTTGK